MRTLLHIVTVIVSLFIGSFVFDAISRKWMDDQIITVRSQPLNGGDVDRLVVILPGAFSSAQYQFEPVATEMTSRATMLYVEQRGPIYRHKEFDAQVYDQVASCISGDQPALITFVGTSMGAGRAWQLAQSLLDAGYLEGREVNFIAIDGVGSADDLAGVGSLGAKYISRLPFGWLWNHVPVAKFVIAPSDVEPLPQWTDHARQGLEMARSTPASSWGGQLRAMSATSVSPDSLSWMDKVVYVRSTNDTSVVRGEQSVATWRAAAGEASFDEMFVEANHTDFEANPGGYARIIDDVIG